MNKIWITSDLHFCHSRDFLWKPRGFNSEWEMNEAIIKNWNSVVGSEDDVYVLGDLMLNNNEEGLHCLKQLKGKIHIIRGNHDTEARIPLYKSCYNVVELCEGKYLNYNNYHFYLSHYPCLCSNYDDDKPLKAKMINLCGHVHTKDKFADIHMGLIYHTELDAHNNTPVSLDAIVADIKNYLERK